MSVHLALRPYTLRFERPLVTAAGVFETRRGVLVMAANGGVVGVGEAAPLPGFSEESLDEVVGALTAWCARSPGEVDGLDAIDRLLLDGPPAARHGAEQALLEWLAARTSRTVCELLGGPRHPEVAVNALVADAAGATRAVAEGARTVKLKVARGDLAEDVARVAAVRAAVGPDVALRLDANQGWSADAAREALEALEPFGIELIEEPTAGLRALATLRGRVPIAADESVRSEADLDDAIALGAADVVVIKPMLVGGLRRAVAMVRRAAAAGIGTIVTTSLEGGVGRRGALDVAAAGPASLACGLDTGRWLAEDIDAGPIVVGGRATRAPC